MDYRCYRIYGKFEKYLNICPAISERNREFISRRLKGETLESIAKDNNLTRERVRQIVKKDIEKVRNYYFAKTGMSLFDEDYFKYLYETYAFEKEDAAEWLGVPVYVWNYLDLNDVKRGKTDLQKALEDYHELDLGLRLKIKNYLNRNKLYVDGRWVEKKRSDLEQVVVRKFCTEDVCFDEFCQLYNSFLDALTGEVLIRFESKGTRYDGRTEQIEKVKVGNRIMVIREKDKTALDRGIRSIIDIADTIDEDMHEELTDLVKKLEAGETIVHEDD